MGYRGSPGARIAAALALFGAARGQDASGAAWARAFPDDRLPELLLAVEQPGGRLQRFAAIAALGPRAHPALLGLLRRPFAPLGPELLDAFGDVDARLLWATPLLAELLGDPAAQAVAVELLARIGPAAAAAAPALERALAAPRLPAAAAERVRLALTAVRAAAPSPPPSPPPPHSAAGPLPPLAELLAVLRSGPAELGWPALQAVLAMDDRAAAVAALRVLLLQRLDPAKALRAQQLQHTLHCVWRARATVPADPAAASAPELAAAVTEAALAGLPFGPPALLTAATQSPDAEVHAALALATAVGTVLDTSDVLLRVLRDRADVRAAAGELLPLLRPRLTAAEREQRLAALRRFDAANGGVAGIQSLAQLGTELDEFPADAVPMLLRALAGPGRDFAWRSLKAGGAAHAATLLAAYEDADPMRRQQLLRLYGELRPTPPAVVAWLCDHAFAARADGQGEQTLRSCERPPVVEELLRRLAVPDPSNRLRQFCRSLRDAALDARLREFDLAAAEVDPLRLDEVGRIQLFGQLRQLGAKGFARMVELLHHPDHDLRVAALRDFGGKRWQGSDQVDVLLRLSANADAEIVAYAVLGLGNATVRKDEVYAHLRGRWDGADEALRENLVRAFAALGPAAAGAADLLAARLRAGAPLVRLAAAYALWRVRPHDGDAAAALRALLADDDVEVRCQTMYWLRSDDRLLRDFAADVVALLAHPDARVKQQVLYCLHDLPPEHARKVADAVRALKVSTDTQLMMWAVSVCREKLGDR